MLRPAWRQVVFNGRIVENDGLLAQHVATSEGTSYEDALEAIRIAVKNWQRILRAGKKVNLAGVGRLFLDEEGTLQFNPAQDINYNIHSYGLFIFRANAMEREDKLKQSVNRALEKRKSGSGSDKKTPEKTGGIRYLVQENRRQIGRWAAVLGPVVALGLVGSYLYTQQPGTMQQAAGYVQNLFEPRPDSAQAAEESNLLEAAFTEDPATDSPQEKEKAGGFWKSGAQEEAAPGKMAQRRAKSEFEPNDAPYEPTELDANINHSLYNIKSRPTAPDLPQGAEAKPAGDYPQPYAAPSEAYGMGEAEESKPATGIEETPEMPLYSPYTDQEEGSIGPFTNESDTSSVLKMVEEAQEGDIDFQDGPAEKASAASTGAEAAISQASSYQIIVGSFLQESNARGYVQKLESKGFAAYLAPEGARTRVALGRFPNEAAARRQLSNIRQALTAGAWIKARD